MQPQEDEPPQTCAVLRKLVDASNDLIWAVDARDLSLLAFNRRLARFAEARGVALRRGSTLHETLSDPRLVDTWQAIYRRALDEGVHVTECRTSDGQRTLELRLELLQQGSTPIAIASFARDVSEQRRAEAERERLEARLAQSQRLDTLGRLVGGVAHDFNNLLTVIQGEAGHALSTLSEPPRDAIQGILDASVRAAALTRQLLAFGRRQRIQPRRLQLNAVVTDFERMLRRLVGEDVELLMSLGPDPWTTLADPDELEQVIMNLVLNARDAMPGGGAVSIETANVELDVERARAASLSPGRHVRLTVRDTGVGMDAVTRERIFEPFFTTKQEKGHGLGLVNVHGIIERCGGSIAVCSAPGAGATFDVYLPVVPGCEEERPPLALAPAATGTETVLLVENDPRVREVCRRALAACGFTVLTAGGPGEALLTCEERGESVSLLLTDVVMPQMSGNVLAARLTRLHPRMKVLFMSGYLEGAEPARPLPSGAHFLAKPFSARALAAAVRRALDDPS